MMNFFRHKPSLLFILLTPLVFACKQDTKWKGQEPLQKVSTTTVPIQKQVKGTFYLGNGIYSSNNFAGARLNGIVLTNDTLITALITPENTPVNSSPWYSFKIWSETEQNISLKLTYLDGYNHRYYPKLSYDGLNWTNLDSANYKEHKSPKANSKSKTPASITMKLSIGLDTLWVSAQELIVSKQVNTWAEEMASKPFIEMFKIGESREGRSINVLKIGNNDDKKMILVLSRQHPPEITGYLAMQSFVETIGAENETAKKFRNVYNTYVIPLVNPDGVDNGHWRHNAGGIDLNRDWEDFNQPEVMAIRKFLENKVATTGGKFYFAVDFHSTLQDIYYTINPRLKGNMHGLVPEMIQSMGREIAGYEPNIQPSSDNELKINSTPYLFHEFGAEALTYEVGDHTPRELLKRKAEIAARKLMELMLK